MILGFNFKTLLAYAVAIGLALLLPPYVAMGLGAIAGVYALARMFRSSGAPNGLPLHRKPAIWWDNARRYGLVGYVFTANSVMMFRLTELLTPVGGSPERLNMVIFSAVCFMLAMMGTMMFSTLKGAAIHAQEEADEAAARGEGPKCTCTRKCGLC